MSICRKKICVGRVQFESTITEMELEARVIIHDIYKQDGVCSRDRLEELVPFLYNIFNKFVFYNKLPRCNAVWTEALKRAAGICSKKGDKTVIRLSRSLLISPQRLANVLAHEMCHSAVRNIDQVREKHGPLFHKWGKQVTAVFPDIIIKRCHSYKVEKKYLYKCIECHKTCHKTTRRQLQWMQKRRCRQCKAQLYITTRQ